jgi:hypothetical protein
MRWSGLLTAACIAEIGVIAVPARPDALIALGMAGLLAVTIAAAESVESGRWRAGLRQLLRAHGAAVSFGVAGCGAALLAGQAGAAPGPVAVAAVLAAVLAIAGLLAVVALRLRR